MIAKLDCDAPNNKALAARYGVDGYPTLKFFPKGSKEPSEYEGGRSEVDLVAYLNEHTGTQRAVGGGLNAVAGTIEILDKLASKFANGGSSALGEAAAEAKQAVEEVKDKAQYKYAEYYVKVFDKLSSNDGYAAKELKRLSGMLSKGGLSTAKSDELTSKTNILRRFIDKVSADDDKGDTNDEKDTKDEL